MFNTLQVYLGSYYVNDFNRFGRTWQVNVQAAARLPRADRRHQADLKVRNSQGRWCRLATFATVAIRERAGAGHALQHVPSAAINADAAAGTSSGQAIAHLYADAKNRAARAHAARMDGAGPVATADRQHGHVGVRAGGGAGVPGAGGAVRKLVAAVGRHPGGADVPAVLHRRRGHRPGWTSTFSRRSASWCWSAWRARTRS